MDGPRTHYQLSFTSRQALWLFVSLLASLGVAFFFGVMAGLAGRPEYPEAPARAAAGEGSGVSDPEPAAESAPLEADRRPSRTRIAGEPASPSTPADPAPPERLETFDDRVPAPGTAAVPALSGAPPGSERFWVQVLSSSSEKEAASRQTSLAASGFPTSIVPGIGPRGAVFRVRLGPYSSREEASRAAERVRAIVKVEPWIVRAP